MRSDMKSRQLYGGPHDGSEVELPPDIDYVLLQDGAMYLLSGTGQFRFQGYDAHGRGGRSVVSPKPPTNVVIRFDHRQLVIFGVVAMLAVWKLADLLSGR